MVLLLDFINDNTFMLVWMEFWMSADLFAAESVYIDHIKPDFDCYDNCCGLFFHFWLLSSPDKSDQEFEILVKFKCKKLKVRHQ